MTKHEKLFLKAKENPGGISFADFQQLLRHADWLLDHQRGSHQIWYSPRHSRLSIQEGRNGKAKRYQVDQFITLFENESKGERGKNGHSGLV